MQSTRHRSIALNLALRRFPARAQLIENEYGARNDFRSLCDDLQLCVDALARWQSSDSPVAAARVAECAQSLAELEQEIETWLNEREARSG
ncbi:MAG: hypothetical protein V2I57_13065 [Xanthomonadales bacterium]|jgi:hypothetical protein|nr:hypothetical protein [Xanthomonadales bacterium]